MEWEEITIDICCDLIAGYAFKSKDFGEFDTKVIRIGDITPPFVHHDSAIGVNLANYDHRKIERYKIKYNDFVLAMTGATIGKVGRYISDVPSYVNQRVLLFKSKEGYDHSFIYYTINSYVFSQYVLNHIDSESAQPNISANTISKFSFKIPANISDQRKIAGILSALDAKIENNNKINANLEAQAQALFKSWFVDFTPFKDQPFVDSELGSIPQGLKICQISDISHTLETGRRQKGGAVSEGIPSVGAEHVKGIGTYDYSKTKYISPEFANKLKTGKINGYELLIYKDGGKPGYFIPNFSIFGEGYPFDLCYLNEHVFKLDFLQNKGYNIFNYFQFKTNYVMSFLNAQGGKAAIPGINKKDIECIYTFAPNNPKVVEFGNFALPLFTKILRNCVENQRLAALRDTLLPKLMSGEIKL